MVAAQRLAARGLHRANGRRLADGVTDMLELQSRVGRRQSVGEVVPRRLCGAGRLRRCAEAGEGVLQLHQALQQLQGGGAQVLQGGLKQ